ncbi:phosphoenolpyruvate--protein phosphotransferase [Alkalilimnicola sp. S0819]|uniref:phosphoenolpyruvate--protein phosphotransferase n=1 Tax=Alkalilimnicola sp. S0819 TaxID=2613922 RepID=UPI001261D4B8|nr:phosphoenolpyruvate--protein phosphotransferase [Alkalilimnicola sp. S0819]KAB7623036.1 phosphoenolpyruvate--protein phosphotransferase [Alkalilimnicola sp. S0819]MPQ17149.1 phosphoenolpyruvate--protein phosphotransferase [Alkalilimnicola sp. S0819]
MLQVLQRIVQEVNAARDLRHALEIIVHRVHEAMGVNVASVYLRDPERGEYVLMATLGLNPEAVGKVRLRSREGLVGLVGEREEPLNLENADQHPRYRYFPETGEERFHSFLGVPIIHYRRLVGVLVVQEQDQRRFEEEEVAFLMTMAAQLAGAIAHAEASGDIVDLRRRKRKARNKPLMGVPGALGVGMGVAMVAYAPADLSAVPDRRAEEPERDAEAFRAAVQAVRAEVEDLSQRLGDTLPRDELLLFDAYLRILDSSSLVDEVERRIKKGSWAAGALRQVIDEHVRVFDEMEDAYLRERAADIRDIGRRLLMRLQLDAGDKREVPARCVLVGQEVNASQLAEIPQERLAGVVSAGGSSSSHVAILARALGVPAVMGVTDLSLGALEGKDVVVDGYAGRLYVEPSRTVRREYRRLLREEAELTEDLKQLQDLPGQTPDGKRVCLYANTGLISDVGSSLNSGCEGIGLHRTEFPFMIRERFPGEEEQTRLYTEVLSALAPRPVTLRTLDVGGDKSLPYFPIQEENPFLGWRGIRLTLDHPEIFLTQLRAMLRANVGHENLQIMFPMISRVDELEQSIALVQRAREELAEEGVATPLPKLGIMIEVPSAVFQIDRLMEKVDFVSVGTNDLTQYILAVDRNNARVADLYTSYHPAVLLALKQVADAGLRHGKPVGVCGGMAGDPGAALLLLAMGVNSLSMSVANLLRVKWVVRSFRYDHALRLLEQALPMDHPEQVRALLHDTLDEAGLGGLVRAGK